MRRPQSQKKPVLGHAASVPRIIPRSAYVPSELLPLWERVKRSIQGSTRQSRSEAFLAYAEEHPGEVVDAQEELSRKEIARLIREERELGRAVRSARRYKATPEELASIPF